MRFIGGDGHPIDIDRNATILPVTVTLDRMDPFSAYLSFAADDADGQRSWIVSLADLLLLAEVLPTPSDFVAYLMKRRAMLKEEVMVFVEADALGAWCEDRLSSIRNITDAQGTVLARMVSNTSDWMNDYFTAQAVAELDGEEQIHDHLPHHPRATEKPNTGIPESVWLALDAMLERNDPNWLHASTAAVAVTPKSWNVVTRLLAAAAGTKSLGRNKSKQMRRAADGLTIDDKVIVQITQGDEGRPVLTIRPGSTTS